MFPLIVFKQVDDLDFSITRYINDNVVGDFNNKIFGYMDYLLAGVWSLVYIYVFASKPLEGFLGVFLVIFTWLFSIFLKTIFKRPRPHIKTIRPITDGSFSFPSIHSAVASSVGSWILIGVSGTSMLSTFLIASICSIALIAASRVYLGAHYLTDVLSGIALGLLMASLTYLIIK